MPPSNKRNRQPQKPTPPPALQELRQSWERLRDSMSQAGERATQEFSAGHTAPSERATEMWSWAVEDLSSLLSGMLHLADGGAYDATGITRVSGDEEAESRQPDSDSASDGPAENSATVVGDGNRLTDDERELLDFSKAARRGSPEATDEDCAAALDRWREALVERNTSLRFARYPGFTGAAAFQWLTEMYPAQKKIDPVRRDSDVDWHKLVWELTESPHLVRTFQFLNPDAPPRLGMYVTEVDVVAQYLAAARSTALGLGDPVILEDVPVEDLEGFWLKRERPGYLQLASAPDLTGQPITVRAFGDLQAGSLLPMPAARYLVRDHGVRLDVDWGLVWPDGKHARRLSKWAELFANGRDYLVHAVHRGERGAELALTVLKMVYSEFLGGMTRSEDNNLLSSLRPDHWDQYVCQAGVNQLRALDKGLENGFVPSGAMKDSVYYCGDHAPIQPRGLAFHDQPGKWSVDAYGEVTERMIEEFEAYRIGRFRDAVDETDKARRKREGAAA